MTAIIGQYCEYHEEWYDSDKGDCMFCEYEFKAFKELET